MTFWACPLHQPNTSKHKDNFLKSQLKIFRGNFICSDTLPTSLDFILILTARTFQVSGAI